MISQWFVNVAGPDRTVTPVSRDSLETIVIPAPGDLQETIVIPVPWDLQETTVTPVLQTLGLLGHVIPVLLDGPETTARYADSDSVLRATALNASRMAAGKEKAAGPIWKFI